MSRPTSPVYRRGQLFRLEWRLLTTARTPWFVACLFLLTSGAALFNGDVVLRHLSAAVANAVDTQAEQFAALKRDIARVEEQRERAGVLRRRLQPGLPSAGTAEARVNTFRAALPPLPTAVLSAGRTQVVPQRYELRGGGGARFWPFGRTVGTHILSGLLPEQPMDNPAALVVGSFDLAFVTIYLYPLLVLALMYDIVSGDRESGILALVSAQPIAFWDWLVTRVAVRGTLIVSCGVLLPVLGTAFIMSDWSWSTVTRLGIWAGSVLSYAAFWMAFAVAVSLRTRTSSVSAVVSVAGWFLLVIMIPAVLALATPFLRPFSTRLSYVGEERAASLHINPRVDAAIAALNQLVRTRYGNKATADDDHPIFAEPVQPPVEGQLLNMLQQPPWIAPMPVAQLSRGFTEARRTFVEQRLAPILAELDANERREAAFFHVTQFLSPALLLQAIGDDVAGVGPARWKRFLGQLDAYVRERDSFFTRKVLSSEEVTSHDFVSSLVPFRYREEPNLAMVSRVVPVMAPLISMAVVLTLSCVRFTRHWRV